VIRSVTIAGHATSWEFRDSRALRRRLESRPWLTQGDVVTVALCGPLSAGQFVEGIEDYTLGLDRGASTPRIVETEADSGVEAALFAAVGRSSDRGKVTARDLFEGELSSRPLILVGALSDMDAVVAARDEAASLVDLASKISDLHQLVVILTVPDRRAVRLDGVLNLTVGMPTGRVLDRVSDGTAALWEAYLHTRVAWECGGDLDKALAYGAELLLEIGDDAALERSLNALSERLADEAGGDARIRELERAKIEESRRGRTDAALGDGFETLGLTWRLADLALPRPTPWAARRLITVSPKSTIRGFLRSAITCFPLAAELLSVCLQLEGAIRDRWSATVDGAIALDGEDLRALERFRSGSSAAIYPPGHPAPPTEPEDTGAFASFGRAIRAVRARQPSLVPNFVDELRDLRNALAHGHYVCWKHVATVARLCDYVARW
jgi:hypothetical protein